MAKIYPPVPGTMIIGAEELRDIMDKDWLIDVLKEMYKKNELTEREYEQLVTIRQRQIMISGEIKKLK